MNRKTIKKLVTYMLVIGLWISFISTSSLAIKDPASEESQMQDAKVDKILEEVRIQTNIEIKSEAKLPDIDLIVESDHVKLKNFPPTWLIWNEDVGFWNEFEGEAIAQADGSQYGIAFFVKADEGFKFTRDTKIYLNNEEVSSIYGNKILLDPEPISAKIYLNMGFVSPDKDPQKVFKVDFIDETHNTETPSLILGEETTILAPAVPQFEGDTFYGWIDEDGKDVDFNNYVIKEDTTFYADWYGAQISGEIKDIEVNINEWANIDLSVKKNNRINSFLLKKIDGNWQEVGQAIDVTDLDLLRLAPSDIEKTEVYKLVIDPGHKYSLESNEFTVTWVNPNPEQDSEAPIPGEESPQVPEEDPQAPEEDKVPAPEEDLQAPEGDHPQVPEEDQQVPEEDKVPAPEENLQAPEGDHPQVPDEDSQAPEEDPQGPKDDHIEDHQENDHPQVDEEVGEKEDGPEADHPQAPEEEHPQVSEDDHVDDHQENDHLQEDEEAGEKESLEEDHSQVPEEDQSQKSEDKAKSSDNTSQPKNPKVEVKEADKDTKEIKKAPNTSDNFNLILWMGEFSFALVTSFYLAREQRNNR